MKTFIFNDCDVCINPNVKSRSLNEDDSCSRPHFEIKTAFVKDKWIFATSVDFPTWGNSSPVWRNDPNTFTTEKDAIKEGAKEIIKDIDGHVRWRKGNDYNAEEKKLVGFLKEIIHPTPVELSLF